MASSESKENMCLVCLEAPAGRKVDTCQHSYCENCLSSPNFACPQCATDGSKDQGEHLADGHGEEGKPGGAGAQETATKNQKMSRNNCKICHFKGKTVKATHVCIKCRKLPLCWNCSIAHGENKTTKRHVVTAIQRPREDRCTIHDEPLELVCTSCSENVCHVCISIEHVGHEIETIHKAVFVEFDKVRNGLEYQKAWLEKLKSDEKELQQSKATVQKKEDVLIKSIDDHADKCIEEILKNKEALKNQVRADFEVVVVMVEKRLEAISELQRASGDIVAEANSLLNEQTELHSTYIEKLVALKQQIDKLKEDHPAYKEDRAKYHQAYLELRKKAITFYPRTPNCDIGGFEYRGPRCNDGGPCVCDTCKKVFKRPKAARFVECRQKGECTCGTCAKVFRFPGRDRVDECRRKRSCICGTCGCWFNRTRLREKGYCAGYFQCNKQTSCGRCGTVNACENTRQHCENPVAGNFIP